MKISLICVLLILLALFGCKSGIKEYELSGKVSVRNECTGAVPDSIFMNIILRYEGQGSPERFDIKVALSPNGTYRVKTPPTNETAVRWEIEIQDPCTLIGCPPRRKCIDTSTKEEGANIVPVEEEKETKDFNFVCKCRT